MQALAMERNFKPAWICGSEDYKIFEVSDHCQYN